MISSQRYEDRFIIIIIIILSLVTGLFFLLCILLLNQKWPPPFRLQVSDHSTSRILCDIPIVIRESVMFSSNCSESFFKHFVTILAAPFILGIIVHFTFHMCCIFIHKPLHFTWFQASAVTYMRNTLFWAITQRVVLIPSKTFRHNLSVQTSRVKNPKISSTTTRWVIVQKGAVLLHFSFFSVSF